LAINGSSWLGWPYNLSYYSCSVYSLSPGDTAMASRRLNPRRSPVQERSLAATAPSPRWSSTTRCAAASRPRMSFDAAEHEVTIRGRCERCAA
jgi:hypothetical protein